jgi:hypothetical protein
MSFSFLVSLKYTCARLTIIRLSTHACSFLLLTYVRGSEFRITVLILIRINKLYNEFKEFILFSTYVDDLELT